MKKYKQKPQFAKTTIFIIISFLVFATILIRLFSLQILKHDHYEKIAQREQYGVIELSAQRGEILIKDYHSNEEFSLATNSTLNLIYADPSLIEDPQFLAETLAPLIFDLEEARTLDTERIKQVRKDLPTLTEENSLTDEQIQKLLSPLTDLELENNFKAELLEKLSAKQRPKILLSNNLEKENLNKISALNLTGIEVDKSLVYAYPPQITTPKITAEALAKEVKIPESKLASILEGKNRYTVLKQKLNPEISDQILEIAKENKEKFRGIGMKEEYFRYYPEGALAANIIGYVDRNQTGQYGIESSFNKNLEGKAGKFQTKRDSIGRQITVGESILQPAKDGDKILLTIDRSIQLKVDQIIKKTVINTRADSGQVIVLNPQTGAIIAMSHYPTFDPNNYGDVFKKVEINLAPHEIDMLFPTNERGVYKFYVNEITLDYYLVFEETDKDGIKHYYRYENYRGPEVYHNKIVSWSYEPGSVFKSIAMAAALDSGDITPKTTYNDAGPVGVDMNVHTGKYDYEIKNATGYLGLVDMTAVLGESLNTGMTFVAKQMGASMFYHYLEKFGFLDKTDIEFNTETKGKIQNYEKWTESELATHAFGQGITVTLLQIANAYAVMANGGILMQPYIVEEIRYTNGKTIKTEAHEIRKVIQEKTATQITDMLVNAIENGVAKPAALAEYYIAGKTGTSQTYKHGKALTGAGTTIGSMAGFGPVDNPKFVVAVKIDHARTSEWGVQTAAPAFKEIMEFLFTYYNIPPDKNPETYREANLSEFSGY